MAGGDDDGENLRALLATDLDRGFVALVEAYGSLALTVAARTGLVAPADAEDVAAEAFLRAYRALRLFSAERRGALRPRAWLVTIVLNTARNARRTAARRPAAALADGGGPATSGALVEDWVEQRDGAARLANLLRALPDRQRTAVVLRHVVCLPVTEIAEVLGCPESTARSHVARGLRRLRDLHGEER